MIKLKGESVNRKERKLTMVQNRRRIKRRCSNIGRLARLLNPVPKFRFIKPLTFICDEHRLILFITSKKAIRDKRFEEQIKLYASEKITFFPVDAKSITTNLRRIGVAVEISERMPELKFVG